MKRERKKKSVGDLGGVWGKGAWAHVMMTSRRTCVSCRGRLLLSPHGICGLRDGGRAACRSYVGFPSWRRKGARGDGESTRGDEDGLVDAFLSLSLAPSVGLDGAGALTHAAFVGALLALGAAFAVAIVALDGAVALARGAILHAGGRRRGVSKGTGKVAGQQVLERGEEEEA